MRRMGDDPQLFQEMVEFLHEDTPRHMALARRSWSERDFGNLVRAAHTLKGLASNFGAARAVAAAAELERLAAKGPTASIDGQFGEVEKAFEELLVALPAGVGGKAR